MKIAYLGAGTWGFALASILAENGHTVLQWTRSPEFCKELIEKRAHPKLLGFTAPQGIHFTHDLKEALDGADVIVESVTTKGIRPVFEKVFAHGACDIPIILTSKGIEQETGFLIPEILSQMLKQDKSPRIGSLSGPSHAEEVIKRLPTSVVCSAYNSELTTLIQDLFTAPSFRVYPNSDMNGVNFGGAMKNIMAIACGMSDGLGFGDNTKAALMTRGLHEIRKLSSTKDCQMETLNGLAGLGDLCVTCLSKLSRNYRFGRLLAEDYSPEDALRAIGMAVEGMYTCKAALHLARKDDIAVPITEATYSIIYEGLNPREAVKKLLQRAIKEEHL